MVASFVSMSQNGGVLGADPVVTAPAGASTNGRLMIAMGVAGSGGTTITPPAGWTAHPNSAGGQVPLWYKYTSSEPASYTFVVSGAVSTSSICIVLFDGVAAANAAEAAQFTQGTSPLVLAQVTAGGGGRLLFAMLSRLASTSWTPPGSMTERYDGVTTGNYTQAGGDEIVGAGPTGTRTWTPGTSGTTVGYLISIVSASQTVAPGGIDSSAALGSPTIAPGSVAVAPSGIASSAALGSPTLAPGSIAVQPGGVDATAVLGSPTIVPEMVSIHPDGIDSSVALGVPTILAGQEFIHPDGIDSSAALGSPTVAPGSVAVHPAGIDSSAVLGTPTIQPGAVSVSPNGIDNTAVLGDPEVIRIQTVRPAGIDSSAVCGIPRVIRQYVFSGLVRDHETGDPIFGAVIRLFNSSDVKVAETTTAADGTYVIYLDDNIDTYWSTAQYMDGPVQVHGVSDRDCVPV